MTPRARYPWLVATLGEDGQVQLVVAQFSSEKAATSDAEMRASANVGGRYCVCRVASVVSFVPPTLGHHDWERVAT